MIVKIAIETWAPEYGSPVDQDVFSPASDTLVDAAVERDPRSWAPIGPTPTDEIRPILYFIDGVRRIDARVWLMDDDAPPRPGACATFAAGAVRCGQRAEVVMTQVDRRLIARAGGPSLETTAGVFVHRTVANDDIDSLFTALQTDMRSLEADVAQALDLEDGAVVVFDGPLGEGRDVRPAIGYVKSHRVRYLDEGLGQVVTELSAGERTPIFVIGERVARFTWYLCLPGSSGGPWSGIVRCECVADEDVESAIRLADLTARMLPAFASTPHKDPRAPQNLYSIAGLERELRRRMGDAAYVERALRVAASGPR